MQLRGDFLRRGSGQVLAINRAQQGGRLAIFDFTAPRTVNTVQLAEIAHWENYGGTATLDGWDGQEDMHHVGDFMGLGYDQLLAINRDPLRRGGRLAVFDFKDPVMVNRVRVARVRH